MWIKSQSAAKTEMVKFGEVIEHLYFADLPRAVAFYTEPLAFAIVESSLPRPQQGVYGATVVSRDQAMIWLYAAIPELAYPKRASFHVTDLDALYAELSGRGV